MDNANSSPRLADMANGLVPIAQHNVVAKIYIPGGYGRESEGPPDHNSLMER